MSFQGQGAGDYIQTVEYKYVGAGAGDFSLVTVRKGFNFFFFGIGALLVVGLIFFIFMMPNATTTTTTTGVVPNPTPPTGPILTTVPPMGPPKDCTLIGDPHIKTFDGMKANYYTPGEYWIVKSPSVSIQGKYAALKITNGLAVITGIAVGGKFLNGNKIIVYPRTVTINDQPILTAVGQAYHMGDISAVRSNKGTLLQSNRPSNEPMDVITLTLPMRVTITVNRWTRQGEGDYLNVKISMSNLPGMDGHCGNFNGIPADDARLIVRKRFGGMADVRDKAAKLAAVAAGK